MAGQRVALLVAFDQFADPRLSELRAPQADIDALSAVLSDPDLGGFAVERLVNGTSQEFRLAVLRLFGQRDPDDFCLLHISSHGLKDASGELYLATRDTQREYLDATSVEATYVRRQLDRSRAGAGVVLLDCCYGGAFERGMATRADGDVDLSGALVAVNEGRGRAVMTASTAIEYAFEGTELHPGARIRTVGLHRGGGHRHPAGIDGREPERRAHVGRAVQLRLPPGTAAECAPDPPMVAVRGER